MRAAGFTWAHWCYDWADDVVYGEAGLAVVRGQLTGAGLKLLDTHGVCWSGAREFDPDSARRARADELHRDRLLMTKALGGDTVVIHPATGDDQNGALARQINAIRALEPLIRELGVTLSIENTWPKEIDHAVIPVLLETFPPDVMGYCFDSGHANLSGNTDWLIEHCFPRLACLHLHDNDGTGDHHRLPGMGTVDWPKVRSAIRDAGYLKPINFELSLGRSGYREQDEAAFLAEAYARGRKWFS
ncbi:MAG: sugar phosphate isomerase/epimerase [Armatimonadetes bacterium]|nr:sugar phosphate isomerase/epimerase [Armatimonadota bacterium]